MTLAVERLGDSGPDLVLLHGWGLSRRIFDGLGRRLAERYRCHLIDLPGHGDSHDSAVGLNNWVDAVIEAAPARAIYVGWSLGGLIALAAARRHPGSVAGSMPIATLARLIRADDWPYGLKRSMVDTTRRGLAQDFATTVNEFLMQQILGEPGAARAIRSLRSDLLAQPPRRSGLEQGLDILVETDLRPVLEEIRQPATLVAGVRDRMAHPEGMAWMAERMPAARCERIERAAHAPFLSHESTVVELVDGLCARLERPPERTA